jgi:O-antigen ligase
MNSIYNSLKIAWEELKEENKHNKVFIPFLLLLVTLPISILVNNVFFVLFIIASIVYKKKKFSTLQISLIVPIVLFFWMTLSYFWSIDVGRTIKAIPKEISLLLLPLMFMFFTSFTANQKEKIIKYYSYSMVIYVLFFLIRATVNFLITKETSYFFYHGPDNQTDTGLVPKLLNAIHVSVYVGLAFFYFFNKTKKTNKDFLLATLLFVFVILLSSKNIIVIFVILIVTQVFFYSKMANKLRLKNIIIILFLLSLIISFGTIKERFLVEFRTNTEKSLSHNVELNNENGVNNISIIEAWQNESFTHNDFFPGTAFRVYQLRMFLELSKEEPIFWKGFGLNASLNKLMEKEKQYNLYPGYGKFNFHNQYVQNFAELGIIGFLLLVIILFINIKNAIKSKDFMHFAFGILMISLFLTESFLWRQRGVMFFMIFYCLFNSKTITKTEIK